MQHRTVETLTATELEQVSGGSTFIIPTLESGNRFRVNGFVVGGNSSNFDWRAQGTWGSDGSSSYKVSFTFRF